MSCYYLVSHGSYTGVNKNFFKIPENIRLIQYTTPGSLLTELASNYIFEQSCIINNNTSNNNTSKNFYIVTENGDLLKEQIKKKVIKPGDETVDIQLHFGKKVGNTSLGFYEKNGNDMKLICKENNEVNVLLSDYLKKISDLVNINNFTGVIDIHQISCRGEMDILEIDKVINETVKNKPISHADLDEVIRSIENMEVDDDIPLFKADKNFLEKRIVLYTDDKIKALGEWRKQNIKLSKTEKKNKTYKKKKEDRLSKNYKYLFKSSKRHSYENKRTTRKTTRKTTKATTKVTKKTNPFLRYLYSVSGQENKSIQ
jgi:hypothetical protein